MRIPLIDDGSSALAAAVLLLLFAAFVSLGVWQLGRAEQKRALYAAFDAGDAAALTLDAGVSLADDRYRTLVARGKYLTDRQFLLDAMTHSGRVGYQVLTPFAPDGARRWLLVNRGWVAAAPDRAALPDVPIETALPEGALDAGAAPATTLRGRIDALPRAGVRLGEPATDAGPWPRVVLFPTVDELSAILGHELYGFQVLLDPAAADGYVREWAPPPMPPATHVGYAVQWFALAAAVAVTAAVLGARKLRRRP